jgi:hypothetical protein
LNNIWDAEPPESWKTAITIPVHRKRNTKDYENHRGTNVLNSGYKIYANIIKNKLCMYYKNKLDEQNGLLKA